MQVFVSTAFFIQLILPISFGESQTSAASGSRDGGLLPMPPHIQAATVPGPAIDYFPADAFQTGK
jgi:hypothetical protein